MRGPFFAGGGSFRRVPGVTFSFTLSFAIMIAATLVSQRFAIVASVSP